jgi:hypothetical protein
MKQFLRGLFDHSRYHHGTRDMPRWVRRRFYRELIFLTQEEQRVTELMGLEVRPRLCLVDEVRVAILRPGDRIMLNLDEEMQRAQDDEAKRHEREQS